MNFIALTIPEFGRTATGRSAPTQTQARGAMHGIVLPDTHRNRVNHRPDMGICQRGALKQEIPPWP
jgi:hypothetical protein